MIKRNRSDSSSSGPAAATRRGGSASAISACPVAASALPRRAANSVRLRVCSIRVRSKYITASASPQARLHPSAANIIVRSSSWPAVATLIVPVKVIAMSRPKITSVTRSTGSRTRARFCSPVPCMLSSSPRPRQREALSDRYAGQGTGLVSQGGFNRI
ncbi:hypothetical protein D3C79_832150 [compost metagenome]